MAFHLGKDGCDGYSGGAVFEVGGDVRVLYEGLSVVVDDLRLVDERRQT